MPINTTRDIAAHISDPEIKDLWLDSMSARSGVTAFAGGGQAGAVVLSEAINRVTTVGTAADSVKLPPASPGMVITIINAAAANAMAVFPWTGEYINALAVNTAISVAANKTITFYCATPGLWNSNLTA
jgi:hypothetical protein